MKSVVNFRDLAQGIEDRIKTGLIFRSGHLDKVKNNNSQFSQLNITTIIDLRGPEEKKTKFKQLNGINRREIPMIFDSDIRPGIKAVLHKKNAQVKMHEIFIKKYESLPFECMDAIKQVFDILCNENNYPVVFHCRAGKDRTGFLSALLQRLLGIDSEHITYDYLLSNNFFRKKMKKYFRLLKILTVGIYNTANLDFIVTTRKEYLDAAFESLFQQYNDIPSYLQKCGVSNEQITNFKRIMAV